MGVTPKLQLPYPEGIAKLRTGYAAIRLLAEAVEAALMPPLLVTGGDGELAWASGVAEVPWDVTDAPARKRGGWTSAGNAERLVVPDRPGWYLVSASVRFAGAGAVDSIEAGIRTRQLGSDVGSGYRWASQRVAQPEGGSPNDLVVTSIVRVADTVPKTGIAVRLAYTGTGWSGSTNPPGTGVDSNKLSVHWLSAL